MTDVVDHASELEQQQRDHLIKTQQQKKEPELSIKGVRCCLGCEEPITLERIKIVNAVRCIDCQTYFEIQQKHRRG